MTPGQRPASAEAFCIVKAPLEDRYMQQCWRRTRSIGAFVAWGGVGVRLVYLKTPRAALRCARLFESASRLLLRDGVLQEEGKMLSWARTAHIASCPAPFPHRSRLQAILRNFPAKSLSSTMSWSVSGTTCAAFPRKIW